MSDQQTWPGWQPPEDGGGQPPSDPPPPPPPPAAWQQAPGPGWPPAGGGPSWTPPETPRSRTPVVIAVVALLILAIGAAGALLTLRRGDRGGSGDVNDELATLLDTIDRSELRMIAFQTNAFDALGQDPTSLGDHADAISQEARSGADDLSGIQQELRAVATGGSSQLDGLQEIRDRYADHMQAWIDYLDAIAGSPALVLPDSADARPYWDDIESTADDFVAAMHTDIPDGAPQDLVDKARMILERGFTPSDAPSGDLVDFAA